jgi:hypothetical protein
MVADKEQPHTKKGDMEGDDNVRSTVDAVDAPPEDMLSDEDAMPELDEAPISDEEARSVAELQLLEWQRGNRRAAQLVMDGAPPHEARRQVARECREAGETAAFDDAEEVARAVAEGHDAEEVAQGVLARRMASRRAACVVAPEEPWPAERVVAELARLRDHAIATRVRAGAAVDDATRAVDDLDRARLAREAEDDRAESERAVEKAVAAAEAAVVAARLRATQSMCTSLARTARLYDAGADIRRDFDLFCPDTTPTLWSQMAGMDHPLQGAMQR